ncbi:MAG: metallophosphatase domain-containing protein [Granulosicoccus sp.]|nr:metallophosphatase domain-containing protein [Granulosicoccus sp.]
MKLVCISDTHGDHEQMSLPSGDVLIHAGDLTAHGKKNETEQFMQWFGNQPFAHKLCVAGNHDTFMESDPELASEYAKDNGVVLLNDSGYQVANVNFWGSPITPRFLDWSFMRDPGEPIEAHWRLIPENTDVLITHGPPHGILDQIRRPAGHLECTGCPSLYERIQLVLPAKHIFGHIHEAYGEFHEKNVGYHNVSSMNEHYRISNDAIVIDVSSG